MPVAHDTVAVDPLGPMTVQTYVVPATASVTVHYGARELFGDDGIAPVSFGAGGSSV